MKSLSISGLVCVFAPCRLHAQSPGSLAFERSRLHEITATAPPAEPARAKLGPLIVVEPEVRLIWNSAIPFSANDGSLWAGKGVNISASGGASYSAHTRYGLVRLTAAPAVSYSRNLPFPIMPGTATGRSPYSSPFHGPESTADLPLRFGDRYLVRFDPGRSEVAFERASLSARLTASNDWWGPAIRNTLVMSNHAPGIPRLELATIRPMRTRAGTLDMKLVAGTLTESNFFDAIPNDYRSLSGAVVKLHPSFDSSLTIGLARVVYGVIESPIIGPIAHSLDVLTRWEYAATVGDTTAAGAPKPRSDQIISLFGRWVFPGSGLEVYAEWARMELPRSSTELLIAGHHSGAYTIGLQWARPRSAKDLVRLQTEFTYLEQSAVFANRLPRDFYTSRATFQGYTQRGQVIGAAIGPGGSSQWLALDYIAPAWQTGVFVNRIRWENDALYREFAANLNRHDVTALVGLRGALRTTWTDFTAEAAIGYRFNYLFQNGLNNPGGYRTVDVRNLTLSFAATPR